VYKVGREPRLKKWIELETYKDKIIKAAEDRQAEFPKYLLSYLSVAFGIPYNWFELADWWKIVQAFYTCLTKYPVQHLPITSPSGENTKEEDWNYDGRTWYLYANMIARSYGWTLEYISRLKVGDALAIIQEISVDEQLEHEFQYGLSEMAYHYNSATKKSEFRPMPRPSWMRPKVEPERIKKFSLPASMIPTGVVVTDGVLPENLLPKEYEKGK
jgi:hypothetical protein